jgi:hypothetical protein
MTPASPALLEAAALLAPDGERTSACQPALDSCAMNHLLLAACLAGLGCGGAASSRRPAEMKVPVDPVAQTLADAFTRKDVTAIRSALRAPLAYSGLLFADAECTRRFPAPATLGDDQLDAFAQCLVSLPFHVSPRDYAITQTALLEYEPGIEAQIRYRTNGSVAWLAAIGFTGHLDTSNTLPTITAKAFEAAHLPTPADALTVAERAELDASIRTHKLGYESVWLDLCVDAAGSITSSNAVTSTSIAARDVFKAQAARWRFRPFEVTGRATPVCSMTHFAYPDVQRIEPVPFAGEIPAANGVLHVHPRALHRVSGDPLITPNDMAGFGRGRVIGTFKTCLDETGTVESVKVLDSTSVPSYDAKIMRQVRTWRYLPFIVSGRPVPVCTGLTFIYTQR